MNDLVAEFDRIVAGDCIVDDVARHQEVVGAIRAALKAEKRPVREDYEELTKSFAQILFQSFQVRAVMDGQPITPPELRDYFAAHPAACHLLKSLVHTAMQSRSRWGMTKQQREAENARRQLEIQRALGELLEVLRQSNDLLNITVAHMQAAATPPSYGYRCPFCLACTDPEGLTCSSCGKALRPLEPPK